MDKIIKVQQLTSGAVAIATKTASGGVGLEIGSGCIFLEEDDLYGFIRLIKVVDKYFLERA